MSALFKKEIDKNYKKMNDLDSYRIVHPNFFFDFLYYIIIIMKWKKQKF